ncbi:MAG: matrixin family metalloprotease [Methylophilaceae bacterium]
MPTPTGSSTAVYSSIFTGDVDVDALIYGTQWASTIISYSFPTYSSVWSTDSTYGYGPASGNGEPWSPYYAPLSSSDQQAVVDILTSWSNASNLVFVQESDTSIEVGDLRFAYTDTADAQAWAYLPSTAAWAGDVWFNTLGTSYEYEWTLGSYEYMTAVHEIGHALGLKHSFETSDYNGQVLDPSLDSRSYTMMSYSAAPGNNDTYFNYEPTTPMILDVAAIQALYGADTTYNAGDSQYVFSQGVYYHQTIWDAGGTDTFVYDSSIDGTIDLTAGVDGGSTMGATIYVQNSSGTNLYSVSNIWIAYDVVIENATGGSGNDTIIGNAANNALTGGQGNDSLDGVAGNDTLIGGLGNDTYVIDTLSDSVTENADEGTDLIRINIATAGGSYSLGSHIENGTLTNVVAYTLTGNGLNNVLTGNAAANILDGGAGVDSLVGGAGNDSYLVDLTAAGAQQDTVSEAVGAGSDTVTLRGSSTNGVATIITLDANVETLDASGTGTSLLNLLGNGLNNTITGNSGNNVLNGGAGSDILIGGLGNDIYVLDSMYDSVTENADEGTDLIRVNIATAGGFYMLALGSHIENVTLTSTVAYNLIGNGLNNTLTGNIADNTLDGWAGNDVLIGGAGNDTYWVDLTAAGALEDSVSEGLDAGTDRLNLRGSSTNSVATIITLDANLETLYAGNTGTSLLNLLGNELNNTLTGNAADNVLDGGAGNDVLDGGTGNDTLIGGLGNDTYVIDSLGDTVTENADEGTDLIRISIATAGGSYTLGNHIENGTLTNTVAYNLTGNSLANVLTGNAANNILDGSAGIDSLAGGAGDDSYLVDLTAVGALQDTVSEAVGAGTDTITLRGSSTNGVATIITLDANVETLDASGTGTSLLNLLGNSGNNTLIGNAANNVLNGGAGSDTLLGGLGNDIYVIDNTSDIVTESAAEGTDLIRVSIAAAGGSYTLADNVENGTLTNTVAYTLTGNSLSNVLTGNAAANTLDGGAGIDGLAGGAGDDIYLVDLTAAGALQDSVSEGLNAGTDTLTLRGSSTNGVATIIALDANLETLDASATGTSLLNLLGNSGNNTLIGNAANNVLNGVAGADTLLGGLGNDIYVIDTLGDTVTENADEGTDLVRVNIAAAGGSYTLGSHIENGTLTNAVVYDLTGNSLENTLTGNAYVNILTGGDGDDLLIGNGGGDTLIGGAGNDWLDGGNGNDTLAGGLGNDILVGGTGSDIFLFDEIPNLATNKDTVSDFVSGTDFLQLDYNIFDAISFDTENILISDEFLSGMGVTEASDANQHILFNTSTGALYYDSDGSGGAVAIQFATLSGVTNLVASDICCLV